MGRDEPPGHVEFVDDGDGEPELRQPDTIEPAPHRLPRWAPFVLLGSVVAALVTLLVLRSGGGAPRATTHSPTPPVSRVPSLTGTIAGPAPRPAAIDVGHPLLDGGAWELFGFGPGAVVRIQPSAGRVTTTPVPSLQSSGPISFVAGRDRVLVRPLDFVAGYEVPDGRPGRELDPPLASGPIFPGPDGRHVWRVASGDSAAPSLVLTALDGRAGPPVTIRLPLESSPAEALADGAGYVIVATIDGYFDARPDALRRITTGSLLAVGPTGWLVAECDDGYRCALWQVDRSDFSRERVPFALTAGSIDLRQRGVLAPDGDTAAVFQPTAAGPGFRLMLLELRTGRSIPVVLPGGVSPEPQTLAWSPDGRWLFAVRDGGELAVVDPRDGSFRELGVPLPPLSRLAVRPG